VTNYLLDAVLFTDNAYNGTSNSVLARNVGYGYKNNIVAKYDGVFWSPISNVTQVLDNTFSSWRGTKSEIDGVAGNGLLYDKCQGGQKQYGPSTTYCTDKGMSMVTRAQSKLDGNTNGVPSCTTWTWTSPYSASYYSACYSGVSEYPYRTDAYIYIRCVK